MDPKKLEGVPKWREGGMWEQFPHNPVFLKWERPLMLSLNCYECHEIFSAHTIPSTLPFHDYLGLLGL